METLNATRHRIHMPQRREVKHLILIMRTHVEHSYSLQFIRIIDIPLNKPRSHLFLLGNGVGQLHALGKFGNGRILLLILKVFVHQTDAPLIILMHHGLFLNRWCLYQRTGTCCASDRETSTYSQSKLLKCLVMEMHFAKCRIQTGERKRRCEYFGAGRVHSEHR